MEHKRYHIVSPDRLFWLQSKIAYLQKRVSGSDLKIQLIGTVFKPSKDPNYTNKKYIVDVVGKTPTIGGYSVLASIKHGDGLNIVNQAPGSNIEIPESYWVAKPHCEHCGHKRSRKETVLLLGQDNLIKQVGKNCLADFLRSDDWANHLGFLAEIEDSLQSSEGDGRLSFGRMTFNVQLIIERTSLALNSLNVDWIGKQDRFDLIRWVTGNFLGITANDKAEDARKLNDRFGKGIINQEKIDEVNEYWKNVDFSKLNSFQRNLKVLYEQKELKYKQLNMAVWIALAVLSETEEGRHLKLKAAERAKLNQEQNEKNKLLNHIGSVGEKGLFKLKIVNISTFDSQYGEGNRVLFQDENNNEAVWFTSSSVLDFKKDIFLNFKATVKEHSTYKGKKQTILSRVKVA